MHAVAPDFGNIVVGQQQFFGSGIDEATRISRFPSLGPVAPSRGVN
jgi:hypothetical protein